MTNSINGIYEYNGNIYSKRTNRDAFTGYVIGTAISSVLAATVPVIFQRPIKKALPQAHKDNYLFKDAFFKSLEISGLDKKGVHIEHVGNGRNIFVPDIDVIAGKNAYYSLSDKRICINTDKLSISGFHELGHAMNHLNGKFGKILQKSRNVGLTIAGIMGYLAIFSKDKPKEAKRNLWDWLKENCGAITFCSLLPIVGEEALASYKGIKLAKKAGLGRAELKKIQKFSGKALLTYIGYAIVSGLSVGILNHFIDVYTRPKRLTNEDKNDLLQLLSNAFTDKTTNNTV